MRRVAYIALLAFALTSAVAAPIGLHDIVVVDGDTIRVGTETVRLVGFDAPETYRARCDAEYALGKRADGRLRQLVAAGQLDLERIACSCPPGTEGTRFCNFGRSCGRLTANGQDVGKVLISEGLARPFHCGAISCPRRRPWC